MKKILIINNNLHIGGVQKALVSLLWNIREQYDITLLLLYEGGEQLGELPPEVKVICAQGAWRYLGMTRNDVHTLADKLGRGFFAAVSRLIGRRHAVFLMSLGQRKLCGFDVAVSYLHNGGDKVFYGGCNDFLLKHVEAKKKVTFLHCDYIHCGADTPANRKQYARFDTIAACSQGCADAFLQACPGLGEKVQVVRNCHRFEQIREAADMDPQILKSGKHNIVTVARLGKEKGVERALLAIARLGALKSNIHYYVVGDGIQRPLLQQIMKDEGLLDTVTLCGQLDNPYGYIKAADLLLIPSYSEAAPLVISEAATLGTPVLSTQTSSAREMIERTGYGWVCENTQSGIWHALMGLLEEPGKIEEKKSFLHEVKNNNMLAQQEFLLCMES